MYSVDGKIFVPVGDEFTMIFQLVTFQGVRYALFNCNTAGVEGGVADFDSMDVHQPYPHGLMHAIPFGRSVTLTSFGAKTGLHAGNGRLSAGAPSRFTVEDLKLGRVALRAGKQYVTVSSDGALSLADGAPGEAQSFQWIETPTGKLVLMALANNRCQFVAVCDRAGFRYCHK